MQRHRLSSVASMQFINHGQQRNTIVKICCLLKGFVHNTELLKLAVDIVHIPISVNIRKIDLYMPVCANILKHY